MYDNPNQPHVLLGTRSVARGRRLEAALSRDSRVILLGVHTEVDALLRALSASPTAVLVVDSALSDCSAHAALYRATLRRPCHAIALASAGSGEFAVEALRAGALDCLLWTPENEPTRELVERILAAALQPPAPFQLLQLRAREASRRPESTHFGSGRLVLLVGDRRATSLCDAVEFLPSHFAGSVLAYRPLHPSLRAAFAAHLARQSSLQVSTPVDGEAVLDGTAYVFSRRLGLEVHADTKSARLRFRTATAVPPALTWAQQVLDGIDQGALSAVVVGWGPQSEQERNFVAAAARRGAAIARKVPGGYEIRWPHMTEPAALDHRGFWDHLSRHLVSHGANFVATPAAPSIWPDADHPAARSGGV